MKLEVQTISLTVKASQERATRLGRLLDSVSMRVWLLLNVLTLLTLANRTKGVASSNTRVVSLRLTMENRPAKTQTIERVTQAMPMVGGE